MPKPDKSEKTLSQISAWTTADKNRWTERNRRFQTDQDKFRLTKTEIQARNDKDIIILADPKILVKKVARLIARHPNVIEVPPAPGVGRQVAQKVENFLYSWDRAVNQKWAMGLHNPYRYDQSFFVVLRGWSAERTMLRPDGEDDITNDPSALFDHQVFDPANIYPFATANEVVRVSHLYTTSWDELQHDPMFQDFNKKLKKDEKEALENSDVKSLTMKAVYWKDVDGGWWHAVVGSAAALGSYHSAEGDTLWIKPPTEIGYNPWTIITANGVAYRQTDWDETLYLESIGTGVLDDAGDTYKYLNRMATKLSELLALESNPPLTLYSATGEVKEVDFQPGARNFLAEKDKLELHKIGPQLNDYQLLWDILQRRADRSGLPPAFFSEYGGESGFSATLLMAAGKDILFPFTECVNLADALKYRKVLEIYRDFGPSKPLQSRVRAQNELGEFQLAEITSQEIRDQGTYVEITREDMTPQEIATRINLALAMVKEKLISLHTARRDWIKLQNPDDENTKVLGEQVYLNEEVIKALVPMALAGGNHELLRHIWEATQNAVPPAAQAPGQAPMPGNPPQPGGIPQGGPPVSPGLPTQILPPTFTGQPGVNVTAAQSNPLAEMNPILRLLSQAQGGAGMGGTPPVPGQMPMPLMGRPF